MKKTEKRTKQKKGKEERRDEEQECRFLRGHAVSLKKHATRIQDGSELWGGEKRDGRTKGGPLRQSRGLTEENVTKFLRSAIWSPPEDWERGEKT